MKILFGVAFTTIVLFFCVHMITQSIKRKKVLPLIIVMGISGVYSLCFYNQYVFYLIWNVLLISQILFLLYVFFFMIVSLTKRRTNVNSEADIDDNNLVFVSIVVAVHNEENVVVDTIKNLLNLDYPKEKYDVTFIDDFSQDKTVEILMKHNDDIYVIDRSVIKNSKEGRGKPAAINENIDKLKGELVCILDADSIIEKDFLRRLVPKFVDQNLGIIQARNIFYNKNRNLITLLTSIDIYSMQHTIYIPLSTLGFGMFEGRAGIFRKKIFKEIGGFDPALPGEDFDFAYRVGLSGYTVRYEDSVFSNEQVTETLNEWFKQRKRWMANYVLAFSKNSNVLYKNYKITFFKKVAITFWTSNLLYALTFNFFGPLILINELKYSSNYPCIFITSFSLTVLFFCCSYILRSKKVWLLLFMPLMVVYYWIFTILQTWILLNEKVLKVNLFYKKAFHRKPLSNEI